MPPTDKVVDASNLCLELGEIVTISEEPGDAEERIRVPDPTIGNGGRDAIARATNHLGRIELKCTFGLPNGFGEVDRESNSIASAFRGLQFFANLGPSKGELPDVL